jgi:predicted ABC-type ATPase
LFAHQNFNSIKPRIERRANIKIKIAALHHHRWTERGRLAKARLDFAFESTLSGFTHLSRLKRWKTAGYRIEIIFLKLSSTQLALRRITSRVKQGGHDVPHADVLRRFDRGWQNFRTIYKALADYWELYDNSDERPVLLEMKQ